MKKIRLEKRGLYLIFDTATVTGFFVALIVIIRLIHKEFGVDFGYSAFVAISGAVSGIVISVVITPFTIEERKQWSNVRSAIVGGVAGYGLKFFDDAVTQVLKNEELIKTSNTWFRVGLFIVCGLFCMIYGYTYRMYYVSIDLNLEPNVDAETTDRGNSPKTRRSNN